MASGLLSTYLAEGLASARPATPDIGTGVICFWYSTDTNQMSCYVEGAWVENILASTGGSLLAGNNLSDLTNTATARTNLGLGTMATQNVGGVQSVPILAAAMTARTTNGAASGSTELSTNKIMLETFDFDQSTEEYVQFMFPMPKSWNESTVTAQFEWTAASGTGDVIWGIQGVAFSNDDAMDAAFGTAAEVTDTLITANDNHKTSFTSAVTIGGTPAEGDLVCFQVYRKAANGSDTLTADAKLIGIRLNITTNAADDS